MSKRTTSIVFFVSAVYVGLLAIHLLQSGKTLTSDSADVSSQAVAADDGARETDQPAVAQGESIAARADANVATPAGDVTDDSSSRQVSLPAQIVQALQLYQHSPEPRLLEAERAFVAEPLDLQWSQSMQMEIFGFFSETSRVDSVQFPTLEVECRTSICRLLFTERVSTPEPLDAPHAAVRALNQKLRAKFGNFREGVFSVDPYGTTATSLVYLSPVRNTHAATVQ